MSSSFWESSTNALHRSIRWLERRGACEPALVLRHHSGSPNGTDERPNLLTHDVLPRTRESPGRATKRGVARTLLSYGSPRDIFPWVAGC